ncbi:MAG: hypothetical protein BWY38_02433 [Ignavibacteria bacterium ADurb.Bin266]|nr:MAG: hypothetical protein BWY38_02433 [Ignavibacteria bacterium ADurb.Bin266]
MVFDLINDLPVNDGLQFNLNSGAVPPALFVGLAFQFVIPSGPTTVQLLRLSKGSQYSCKLGS